MNVTAHLYAFQNGKRREIEIPDHLVEGLRSSNGGELSDLAACALAFHHGQNDVQPVLGCCSVSVNDVIELPNGRAYRVTGAGFELASVAEPVPTGIAIPPGTIG